MRVVHVSADHPDSWQQDKTPAVANLLQITAGALDHHVYSLNRISPSGADLVGALLGSPRAPRMPIEMSGASEQLRTLKYWAPPRGFYLLTLLEPVADLISSDIARGVEKPQLLHGHKLTIEGIVVARISRLLGLPYVLTAQGNTDCKVINLRPDLRELYRKIYLGAEVLFCYAPWMQRFLEKRLGRRDKPTVILPVPTMADRILPPRISGPSVTSAFNLRFSRLKNADAIFRAANQLAKEFPDFRVTILGGPAALVEAAQLRASKLGASPLLTGPVPHAEMQQRFNRSGGFALASKRESFGMVFVEAALAGCPIVYPMGRAVDGLFRGCEWAIAVDPTAQESVTDGIRKLVRDERRLKTELALWHQSPAARRLQRTAISGEYVRAVSSAIGVLEHSPGAEAHRWSV
jgi:glycosyltransferase involved in cell wall biosynthesis